MAAPTARDLDELAPLFVAEFSAKAGKHVKIIPGDAWDKLRAHHWPGNVRELRNVIERCVLFAEGAAFPSQWLQLPGQTAAMQSTAGQERTLRDYAELMKTGHGEEDIPALYRLRRPSGPDG